MAYIFVGNYSRAKEILEKAFQKEPTNCENNYYLAMAYFRLNNFVRAESLLADIVQRVEPGNKLRIMADSMLDQIRDKLDDGLEPSSEYKEDYSDQPKDSPVEDFDSGEDEEFSVDESSAGMLKAMSLTRQMTIWQGQRMMQMIFLISHLTIRQRPKSKPPRSCLFPSRGSRSLLKSLPKRKSPRPSQMASRLDWVFSPV